MNAIFKLIKLKQLRTNLWGEKGDIWEPVGSGTKWVNTRSGKQLGAQNRRNSLLYDSPPTLEANFELPTGLLVKDPNEILLI